MERLPISENEIKNVLKNRNQIISTIHTRIEYLNRDIYHTSDIIEAVSLRSKALSDMPRGGGGHKDLFAEYEKYHNLLDKRCAEYTVGIHQLILQEERVERLWICFSALDADAYNILYRLYVENELYQTVERESGLTHPIFEKKRKRAMQDIMRLYNSELENGHIFELSLETSDVTQQKQDNMMKEHNQQITLLDILNDNKEGTYGT